MNNDQYFISSTSRSKLRAFRYVDTNDKRSPTMLTPKTNAANTHAERNDDLSGSFELKQNAPENKSEVPGPRTPAHRIPLADLISNTEDAIKNAPGKMPTPDDRVFWKHELRSSDSQNPSVTPVARGKKRARSVSPVSSPLNAESKQPLPKILKTPQHDMLGDLWSKYLGKDALAPEDGNNKPRLPYLLSSSPETPAVMRGKRDSVLRRTNSCNADWPTSHSKRRRVDGDRQANRVREALAESRGSLLDSEKPRHSKINLLVEKIQETLLKGSEEDNDEPSSSTPLPERLNNMDQEPSSPVRMTDDNQHLDTPSKGPSRFASAGTNADKKIDSDGSFPELDDDFFDNEFFELAGTCQLDQTEASVNDTVNQNQHIHIKNVDTVPEYHGDMEGDGKHIYSTSYPNNNHLPSQSQPKAGYDNDLNEFGSDDHLEEIMQEEFTRDDKSISAGQIMDLGKEPPKHSALPVDTSNSLSVSGNGRVQYHSKSGTMSDDEFDEFDDDIDLEAIEQAMVDTGVATSSDKVGGPMY